MIEKSLGIHFINNDEIIKVFNEKREVLKLGFDFSFLSKARNINDKMTFYPLISEGDFESSLDYYQSCLLFLNKSFVFFDDDEFLVYFGKEDPMKITFSGKELMDFHFNLLAFNDFLLPDESTLKRILLKINKDDDLSNPYKKLDSHMKNISLIKLKKSNSGEDVYIRTIKDSNMTRLVSSTQSILIKEFSFFYLEKERNFFTLVEKHIKNLFVKNVINNEQYLRFNFLFDNFKKNDIISLFDMVFEMHEARIFDEVFFKMQKP